MAEDIVNDEEVLENQEITFNAYDLCHIIGCTPVFDANAQVPFCYLSFTAGNRFITDALEEKHLHYILTEFFIRRKIASLIGEGRAAIVGLPLSEQIMKYVNDFPLEDLVIHLGKYEEPSVENQQLLRKLSHLKVRFALDMDTFLGTAWHFCRGYVDMVVVDVNYKYLDVDLMLYRQIKRGLPHLKLVFKGFSSNEEFERASRLGADYIASNLIDQRMYAILREAYLAYPKHYLMLKLLIKDEPDLTQISYLAGDLPGMIEGFFRATSYISSKREAKSGASSVKDVVTQFGRELTVSIFAVVLLYLGYITFKEVQGDNPPGNLSLLPVRNSLIRGLFIYFLLRHAGQSETLQTQGFITGLFSIWAEASFKVGLPTRALNLFYKNNVKSGAKFGSLVEAIHGFESINLTEIAGVSLDSEISVGLMIKSYDKALMLTEELMQNFFSNSNSA